MLQSAGWQLAPWFLSGLFCLMNAPLGLLRRVVYALCSDWVVLHGMAR